MKTIVSAALFTIVALVGNLPAQETPALPVEITAARLRGQDVDEDLTYMLRQIMQSGVPSVTVVTETFYGGTTPAPGPRRTLDLRYSVNGKPRHTTFKEGEKVFFRELK